ncbi:hypothetical protein M8J76_007035 [Diaphorina citri]|nr:hypothetical protein M8J75_003043 [Diaphorina citri]KAI5729829.1 hypothetical protein M8J76_007035 [Diaphorina citri]
MSHAQDLTTDLTTNLSADEQIRLKLLEEQERMRLAMVAEQEDKFKMSLMARNQELMEQQNKMMIDHQEKLKLLMMKPFHCLSCRRAFESHFELLTHNCVPAAAPTSTVTSASYPSSSSQST